MPFIKSNYQWVLILVLVGRFGFAHSPTTSTTFLTQEENGKWTLQIRAALTAFEQEVHHRYGTHSYQTPEEFEGRMAQIVENEVNLNLNNRKIILPDPQIRLGHETLMVYEFESAEKLQELTLQNSVFKNIYNSKNTLYVIQNGLEKNQFTLNRSNAFLTITKLDGNQLVGVNNASKESTTRYFQFAGVGLFSLLMGLWFFKRRSLI